MYPRGARTAQIEAVEDLWSRIWLKRLNYKTPGSIKKILSRLSPKHSRNPRRNEPSVHITWTITVELEFGAFYHLFFVSNGTPRQKTANPAGTQCHPNKMQTKISPIGPINELVHLAHLLQRRPPRVWSPRESFYPSLPGSRPRDFIAMRIQHSYTSSTNGWTFRPHVLTLSATEIRRKVHSCWDSNSQIPTYFMNVRCTH